MADINFILKTYCLIKSIHISDLMSDCGLNEVTFYRWKKGRQPSKMTFHKIAKGTGLTMSEIKHLMSERVKDSEVLRELQNILDGVPQRTNMMTNTREVSVPDYIDLRVLTRLPCDTSDFTSCFGGKPIMVPIHLLHSASHVENCCIVQVSGNAMEPVLIPGSYAICDIRQKDTQLGQYFVLRYNGEMIVREVKIEGHDALLIPANKKYKAQRVEPDDDFAVIGRVIGRADYSPL